METKLELHADVDRGKCCGYAVCAEICPSVFKLDADGFAYTEGPIRGDDEEAAAEAAESCPEEAITLTRNRPTSTQG